MLRYHRSVLSIQKNTFHFHRTQYKNIRSCIGVSDSPRSFCTNLPNDSEPKNALSRKEQIKDLLTLSKCTISLPVAATAFIGYYTNILATGATLGCFPACEVFFGTYFLASAAGITNQIIEVNVDSQMKRTENRPLVKNRISMASAYKFTGLFLLSGFSMLSAVSLPAAQIGVSNYLFYILYTYLKPKKTFSTLVGAIVGGLPPVMGYVAANGAIFDPISLAMFSSMFMWQLHHFAALNWNYKDEYLNANIQMLSSFDKNGTKTLAAILSFPSFILLSDFFAFYNGYLSPVSAGLSVGMIGMSCYSAFKFWSDPTNSMQVFKSSFILLMLLSIAFMNFGREAYLKNKDKKKEKSDYDLLAVHAG